MPPEPTDNSRHPIAVLGAGELVSQLRRLGEEINDANYEFNAYRLSDNMQATHTLRPADLRNMVKLCQVLAFTIADDGWLPDAKQTELFQLADELNEITLKWSENADG